VLDLAAAGTEVILSDGATLRARLLPMTGPRPRVAALHAGALVATSDFDAALPEAYWIEKP
jgi:antitoxin (DNA-binding transcriptional repressor) of toxin-antitoxin stability system